MSNVDTPQTTGEKALSVDVGQFSMIAGCFGTVFGLVFSTMFFGIGSMFLWVSLLSPLLKSQSAQSWVETPCTIVESFVKNGESPRAMIKFAYSYQGNEYESSEFRFSGMNTGDRASQERLVAKYPADSQQTCYVNPEFPAEAVLDRSLGGSIWIGLFSLPFITVGLVGYYVTFNIRRFTSKLEEKVQTALDQHSSEISGPLATRLNVNSVSTSDYDDDDLQESPGPVTLKSESHPWGTFIFVTLFGLFWNGITIAVSAQEVMGVLEGNWKWSLLFFIPFYLVGIGFLIGMVYCFLALFNPTATVTLSRQLIPLAGSASIDWVFNGSTRSFRNLKISIQGEEQATYRRGTDTTTDTNLFYDEVVYETQVPMEMSNGRVEFVIPSDTMHSFTGGNNKIVWNVRVHGDIPVWPDVSESFPIRVVPHE